MPTQKNRCEKLGQVPFNFSLSIAVELYLDKDIEINPFFFFRLATTKICFFGTLGTRVFLASRAILTSIFILHLFFLVPVGNKLSF